MRRVMLILSAILTVLVPGSAIGADPESFAASGRCTEAASAVTVDAAAARALVPDRFELEEVGRSALLAVFSEECESGVGDGPWTPSFFGGAFIMRPEASRSWSKGESPNQILTTCPSVLISVALREKLAISGGEH